MNYYLNNHRYIIKCEIAKKKEVVHKKRNEIVRLIYEENFIEEQVRDKA